MNPLTAETQLERNDHIQGVMLDEDFLPSHKSDGFVPYDILFTVDGSHEDYDEDDVDDIVDETIRSYDTVVSIEENTTDLDGDALIFLSLNEFAT